MTATEWVARSYVTGVSEEWQALNCSSRPIVLMEKVVSKDTIGLDGVAPNVPYLGVMLPYSPLHYLLFESLREISATQVLVMTSANVSGDVLATEYAHVVSSFPEQLDFILDHNRDIQNPCDDSLVHFVGNKIRPLRLARGYAPLSVNIEGADQALLAMGAQQKSTIAFVSQNMLTLSPYLGELESLSVQERYQNMMHWLPSIYHTQITKTVTDLHSRYFSTHCGQSMGIEHESVQHHFAHTLAVLAEHNISTPVMSFVFDGTGLGDDGTIWGRGFKSHS